MARHRQNFVWQYHNGGIWPMVGGFWVVALVAVGEMDQARRELVKLARVCCMERPSRREECAASRGMQLRF